MWVAPELRRRGVGRLLVEQAVAWAGDTGADAVELWVTRGNYAAIAMYRNSGFTLKNEHQPLPSGPVPGRGAYGPRSPEEQRRLSQAQSGSSGNPAYLTWLRSSCRWPGLAEPFRTSPTAVCLVLPTGEGEANADGDDGQAAETTN